MLETANETQQNWNLSRQTFQPSILRTSFFCSLRKNRRRPWKFVGKQHERLVEFCLIPQTPGSDSTLSIMSENSYQYVLRRSGLFTDCGYGPICFRHISLKVWSKFRIGILLQHRITAWSLGEKTHFLSILWRTLSGNKAKLTCAKFSSVDISGKHPLWLAVGTEDGCIHTFRFKERVPRVWLTPGFRVDMWYTVGWMMAPTYPKHEAMQVGFLHVVFCRKANFMGWGVFIGWMWIALDRATMHLQPLRSLAVKVRLTLACTQVKKL